MFQSQLRIAALFMVLSVFSVWTQSNPPTTCQTATNLPIINSTLLKGLWYEEIRAPADNVSCVGLNVNLVNNYSQLNITSNYSPTKSGLKMDKYEHFSANVSDVNQNAGFNIVHNNVTVTLKILSVDYNSSLVLCGYTNASTSFGSIFARQRVVDSDWLNNLKGNASLLLPAFNANTTGNITQSKFCKESSASTSVPATATLFVAFYALLKLF